MADKRAKRGASPRIRCRGKMSETDALVVAASAMWKSMLYGTCEIETDSAAEAKKVEAAARKLYRVRPYYSEESR